MIQIGDISSTFLAVKVSNNSTEVRSRVTIQSVQLLPEQGFRENESYTTMSLDPGTDEETLVPVEVSGSLILHHHVPRPWD